MTWSRLLYRMTQTAPDSAISGHWQIEEADRAPELLYAIGDVHGCLELLVRLEQEIIADWHAEKRPARLVVLGDFVDRGPDSKGVIDHLLSPLPDGLERTVLGGNHEAMMCACLYQESRPQQWLDLGGFETLLSYGLPPEVISRAAETPHLFRRTLLSVVPARHIDFLDRLRLALGFGDLWLVHAGIVPGRGLREQARADLLWRRGNDDAGLSRAGLTLVHGHSPQPEILVTPNRINLDTGAYVTRKLSAAKFCDGRYVGQFAT